MWVGLLDYMPHEVCTGSSGLLQDTFIRQLMSLMGVEPRGMTRTEINVEPSILIANRVGTRKIWNIERLVGLLQNKYPKSEITVANFAELTLPEQARLASKADVFVGYHGAEMTQIIFQRPGSAVVELNLVAKRSWDYVCELRRLAYFRTRTLEKEQYQLAVNGTPLPEGWKPGSTDVESFKLQEWVYVTDEQWLEVVGAAVLSQRNKLFDHR